MKRFAVFCGIALLCISCSSPTKKATPGVPLGTPVVARFNPDNNIVTAVEAGAKQVGLGIVTAVGFHPDCSSLPNTVIVCRNSTYTNGQTSTAKTPTTCVVQLDPKLGAGARADRVTRALRQCL